MKLGRPRAAERGLGLLLVAFFSLPFAAACAKNPRSDDCPPTAVGTPVDPALLAFLSRARAAHHGADLREAAGDLGAAAREIEAVVSGPLPPQRDAAEVREVLADSLARLAELATRRDDFASAEGNISRGLELVPEPNYFRGHLVEVRGLLEERRSKVLAEKGDATGAAKAKERALESFSEAMRIQSEVIERATKKP